MIGSKKCGGNRVMTSVLVRCGELGLDIVSEGGEVGEPGDPGMEIDKVLVMVREIR